MNGFRFLAFLDERERQPKARPKSSQYLMMNRIFVVERRMIDPSSQPDCLPNQASGGYRDRHSVVGSSSNADADDDVSVSELLQALDELLVETTATATATLEPQQHFLGTTFLGAYSMRTHEKPPSVVAQSPPHRRLSVVSQTTTRHPFQDMGVVGLPLSRRRRRRSETMVPANFVPFVLNDDDEAVVADDDDDETETILLSRRRRRQAMAPADFVPFVPDDDDDVVIADDDNEAEALVLSRRRRRQAMAPADFISFVQEDDDDDDVVVADRRRRTMVPADFVPFVQEDDDDDESLVLRRSARIAGLRTVNYRETSTRLPKPRRSARLAKLPRVNYKE